MESLWHRRLFIHFCYAAHACALCLSGKPVWIYRWTCGALSYQQHTAQAAAPGKQRESRKRKMTDATAAL